MLLRRRRSHCLMTCLAVVLIPYIAIGDPVQAATPNTTPSSDDTFAELATLQIEAGRQGDAAVHLLGPDVREQLVVTGHFNDGASRDLSAAVSYSTDPLGVVAVDETGLVTPLADGSVSVIATTPTGVEAALDLHVTNFTEQIPINFPNQIVPIFTKLGCNGGGCHGKASGQNGFKLSLLGFEPPEDYEYLVKEARGRRLFPAAPDRSLLLQKAANVVPHGGGQRLTTDSHEYRLLRRWIAQGMPYGSDDDPQVTHIEVVPPRRQMARHDRQQLTVVAHLSDGSTEDVTRMTQFEANDTEMAETTATGVVETLDLTGDVAVMARYQSHVGVFRAAVPLGVAVEDLPEPKNFIDDRVTAKLVDLGVPPSPLADDSAFLRRVTLDIAGRLPTQDEVESFLASDDPAKRDRYIDTLLDGHDYADYFGNKWAAILRNKRRAGDQVHGTFAFHGWIRQSIYENKPYDQFVREIVAAAGDVNSHPPVVWYREVKDVFAQVEDTAQLFLGLRIQCARCHHHPFEKWSQDDYYSLAAFFSRVKTKDGDQPSERRVYHNRGTATYKNPKTGQALPPAPPGGEPVANTPDEDPRHALADWMADPANPFFARALVNRYWKHFFDRGLVDPEDDMRVTNPASNPELLDALAADFVESGFDLKHLVRTICQSNTYQTTSLPNDHNLSDKQNFSRFYPRRLPAEVLLDSINDLTKSHTDFGGLPAGTRAVQLPDQGSDTYFLTVFGSPQNDTACECERSAEANLAQSLHLLNSEEMQSKLTADSGRASALAADEQRSHAERIRDVYLSAFAREPDPEEIAIAMAHIEKTENKRAAYEDILWALINTKEFLFNH